MQAFFLNHLRRGRRGAVFLLAASVLLLASGLFPGCRPTSPPSNLSEKNPEDQQEHYLKLHEPVARVLAGSTSHSYRISVRPRQFLRLVITQRELAVDAVLWNPAGRKEGETGGGWFLSKSFPALAAAAGAYRLEIKPLAGRGGHYQVELAELRAEAAGDQQRVAAATALQTAEALRREARREASEKALAKYQEAHRLWQELGALSEDAETLNQIGEIHAQLGAVPEAQAAYGQALELSRKSDNRRAEARALNNRGALRLVAKQQAESHADFLRALHISFAHGDQQTAAQALTQLGEYHYRRSERLQALGYFTCARDLAQSISDRRGLAQLLNMTGHLAFEIGQVRFAYEQQQQARQWWESLDDKRGQARTFNALAVIDSARGERRKALAANEQARALFQAAGDEIGEARTLNLLGSVYQELGEFRQSLSYYGQALALFRKTEQRTGASVALLRIGRNHELLGDRAQALDFYRQSLRQLQDDARVAAYVWKWIGDVEAAQGRRQLALRHYRQALALSRKAADQHGQAYTLNSIGYLQEALGERQQAAQSYQAALQLARNVEEQSAEALTLYQLARNASARGQLPEACALLAESLKLSEKLRVNVASRDLRTSYFVAVHRRYELYTDVLMRQHWRNPTGGFARAALEASEQARARSLPEVLNEAHADLRQGVEPALLAQADDLRQRLNVKAQRKVALLNGGAAQAEVAALTREIGDLNSELDQVQGRIRDSNPHYAALLQPAPPRLAEIQQTLDDTLLLEYALGAERSYLWLVSREGLEAHQLPPRAEIEQAAKPVYELLNGRQLPPGYSDEQRRAQYEQKAQTLSRMLLGPVAARLGEGRLLIVADGILQYLPFGALPEPQRRGAFVPLLSKHEISYLPSAATLGLLRQESARRQTAGPPSVAVLADPFFDLQDKRFRDVLGRLQGPARERLAAALSRLRNGGAEPQKSYPRLFSSAQEAAAIEALLPPERRLIATGAAASRELVLCGALNHYRIVHLAAHGDFNSAHPELSALVFAQYDGEGVKKDGHLWLHDIYNLRLSADLVVLSACDTALGREVRGEGLLGLTRGFMYAGAARVLASLWRVDDDSTAALMKEFYRRHLLEQQPVSAALRQAQLALLNDPQHPQWQAPWHWAAFVLQGDWR